VDRRLLWPAAQQRGRALFSLLAVAVVSLVVYRRALAACFWRSRPAKRVVALAEGKWRLVLAVELLFAVALVGGRCFAPTAGPDYSGGEKFMEIMYLNSIGRSDYFPPTTPGSAAMHQLLLLGYVMIAMLTRLSGFPAHLTFNVGLASSLP